MSIQELLAPDRVALGVVVQTKDDLFERLSALLAVERLALTAATVKTALLTRECLGSTGLGSGIALPHGRVPGLTQAIGAFCTLAHPLEFGAIDHKPVTLAFALLVPEHANNEHLQILAQLAGRFNDRQWREQLTQARTPEQLYNHLIQPSPVRHAHDTQTHRPKSI